MSKDTKYGAVAQLGERRTCTAEVVGSIPISSTPQRPVRLVVRTSGFHPGNRSSILLPATNCLHSSVGLERLTCNEQVVGSNPTGGST